MRLQELQLQLPVACMDFSGPLFGHYNASKHHGQVVLPNVQPDDTNIQIKWLASKLCHSTNG